MILGNGALTGAACCEDTGWMDDDTTRLLLNFYFHGHTDKVRGLIALGLVVRGLVSVELDFLHGTVRSPMAAAVRMLQIYPLKDVLIFRLF